MRRYLIVAVALAAGLALTAGRQSGAGAGDARPGADGLQVIRGELRAASGLFAKGKQSPAEPSDQEALARGTPGGVLTPKGLTLLLVDGRVLAGLRAAQPRWENVVRVTGILHDEGRSMTPLRVEYLDDGKWLPFDLPLSGTTAPGVQGGDE